MRVLNRSLIVLALTSIGLVANSQYPEIPLNTFQRPPVDLVDAAKKPLQQADISQLFLQNKDISRLNPIEDKFWQAPSSAIPAVDPQAEIIKQRVLSAGGVEYIQRVGGNREIGLFSLMVKMRGSSDAYGLTLGTQVHTSLVRAAMLRKLGFFQNTPIFFKELKIQFPSKTEKDTFITSAFCGQQDKVTATCINIDPFKSDLNPQRPEPMLIHNGETGLFLRSVYLEIFTAGVPSLIDGLTPATPDKIELFGAHRTFRSLAAPFMVSDLGESLNRTEQEPATLRDGRVKLKVNFGSDFRNTDHFDLRWVMRNMAALTVEDWDQILDAGQYPDPDKNQCLKKMAYNGLVGRMRNLIALININTIKNMQENPHIELKNDVVNKIKFRFNCGNLIKDGNLTREFFEGSPIRFAHGLVDSPWGKGDLLRGMLIRIQSGLMQTGLALLSAKIAEKKEGKTDGYIMITPEGPDVLAKGNENAIKGAVDASRVINTGTIMGSEAPVQMIDNLSISLGASNSKFADLVGDVARIGTAGVEVRRDFTYVKPIGSMDEAKKTSILKVLDNHSRLKDLAEAMDSGKIGEFLQGMKIHEVYSITDTISLEGTYAYNYGLDAINMLGLSVMPSILVGVSGRFTVVGQTMFMRTPNGIQVVIRRLDPENNRETSGAFFVSVKALFEFFHFNWSKTNARYLSDIFNITYDQQFMNNLCPRVFALMDEHKDDPKYLEADCENKQNVEAWPDSIEKRQTIELAHTMKRTEPAAVAALKDLIYDSDSTTLRQSKILQDSRSTVANEVDLQQKLLKAFFNRQIEVKENQTVMFWEPKGYASKSKTNGQPINIAISRIGHLSGQDKVGFGLNVLDGYASAKLGKKAILLSQNVLNPAGMPKGKAHWRIAETQSEISSIGSKDGSKMPSLAMLKYVWGGWSIEQGDLDEIIQQVNQRVPEEYLKTTKLVPDGVFDRVGKIDFYQLMVTLKVEPEGLENLRKLFLSPDIAIPASNENVEVKRGFLKKFLNKLNQLNQKITGKYRPQDKVIFDTIVGLYGQEQYSAECTNDAMNTEAPVPYVSSTYAGTDYSCLSKWVERLIDVSRKFDANNVKDATEFITEVLFTLDEKLPIQSLLNVIGMENYRYGANVFGFRAKDENAVDATWTSPVFGEPPSADLYQNLLTGELSRRHNLSPLVIDRKMMPF